jgi:hypothetical protein
VCLGDRRPPLRPWRRGAADVVVTERGGFVSDACFILAVLIAGTVTV